MRLGLVAALRQAIEGDALVVHYHPKISVASGLVCGAEALVRWNHPIRGVVSPDEFIPVAEQSGLVRELTKVVLKEAIASNARLRHLGYDIPISINISARTLHDLGLATTVAEIVEQHGLRASRRRPRDHETTIMENPARSHRRAGAAPGPSRQDLDGRLRYRPLVAGSDEDPAHRRAEDRQVVHHRDDPRVSRRPHCRIERRSRSPARHAGRRRRGGDESGVADAAGDGLRRGPGLLLYGTHSRDRILRWLQEHDRKAARTTAPISAVAWEAFGGATFELTPESSEPASHSRRQSDNRTQVRRQGGMQGSIHRRLTLNSGDEARVWRTTQ